MVSPCIATARRVPALPVDRPDFNGPPSPQAPPAQTPLPAHARDLHSILWALRAGTAANGERSYRKSWDSISRASPFLLICCPVLVVALPSARPWTVGLAFQLVVGGLKLIAAAVGSLLYYRRRLGQPNCTATTR